MQVLFETFSINTHSRARKRGACQTWAEKTLPPMPPRGPVRQKNNTGTTNNCKRMEEAPERTTSSRVRRIEAAWGVPQNNTKNTEEWISRLFFKSPIWTVDSQFVRGLAVRCPNCIICFFTTPYSTALCSLSLLFYLNFASVLRRSSAFSEPCSWYTCWILILRRLPAAARRRIEDAVIPLLDG